MGRTTGRATKRSTRPGKSAPPRSARGKSKEMNPATLATAEAKSAAGLRERTEVGHLAAGRVPPSQRSDSREPSSLTTESDRSG